MRLAVLLMLAIEGPCCSAFASSTEDKDISELPNYIKAPDSGLALIADYDHLCKGEIPVYLVNRSGKDIQLRAQDGGVYLKLEYQDAKGVWKRAEPHGYSWCGNSYDRNPTLRNNRFVVIPGYQPAAGESAAIRFGLHGGNPDLASNVGHGLINREEVQSAETDVMAVKSGDFALVSAVAAGEACCEEY